MSGSDTDAGIKRMKKEDSDDDYDSSHTQHNKSDGVSVSTDFHHFFCLYAYDEGAGHTFLA